MLLLKLLLFDGLFKIVFEKLKKFSLQTTSLSF